MLHIQDRGDRTDAANYIFLFSDGGANLQTDETIPEAIASKVDNIHIASVSVGTDTNMMMLRGKTQDMF